MQSSLLPFLSGQPSSSTYTSKPQPEKHSSIAEVYLGQGFRDDAFECSALLCNFFDSFYHQLLCIYGRYSANQLKTSSFNGIFTKRCTDKRAVEYFQKARPTLRRWLLHQQIRTFAIVVLNADEEIVAEFRVNFYEPKIGMKRWVHEFDTELEALNEQLCKVLTDLQNAPELEFINELTTAPSFQIHIHSNGELEEPQASLEHEWQYVDSTRHSPIGTLHSSNQQVSCPLTEMRFNYLTFNPIDENDIEPFEKFATPELPKEIKNKEEQFESDVIVLD